MAVEGAYSTVTGWLNSGKLNWGFLGALALTSDSSENISIGGYYMLNLGAVGNVTYSGTLTPYCAGGSYCYRLGGGGGTLTVTQPLTDFYLAPPTSLSMARVRWCSPIPATATAAKRIFLLTGRCKLKRPAALPSTSSVFVESAATLALNDYNQTVSGLQVGTTGNIQLGSGTLTVDDDCWYDTNEIDGSIHGSGGVIFNSIQVVLNNVSDYSGGTTVCGELDCFVNNALPVGGDLIVNAGGLVHLWGTSPKHRKPQRRRWRRRRRHHHADGQPN